MGTRADFYIIEDGSEEMEWLGSIAYDGYPDCHGYPAVLRTITDADKYRWAIKKMIKDLEHGTLPKQGWPWEWDDSSITDCAYLFCDNGVYIRHAQDGVWIHMTSYWIKEDAPLFPNMKKIKKVARGIRSGFLVLGS